MSVRHYISILFFFTFFACTSLFASFPCKGAIGGRVGQCAQDFTLLDLDSKPVSLSSLQGKVIFLNFWATWCAPCAEEIPWMESLQHKLLNKDIVILTVSIDSEGPKKIQDYFQEQFRKAPMFKVLLDSKKSVSSKYGTFKVPETYIIDKTGKIRDKVEGIKDWNDPMILHYLELLASQ